MKTIWKYSTPFNDTFKLEIPKGAKILTIQVDNKNNYPTIWALVDLESELETRHFEFFGTGIPIHDVDMGFERKYIGTYQIGEFVGHIFEIIYHDKFGGLK